MCFDWFIFSRNVTVLALVLLPRAVPPMILPCLVAWFRTRYDIITLQPVNSLATRQLSCLISAHHGIVTWPIAVADFGPNIFTGYHETYLRLEPGIGHNAKIFFWISVWQMVDSFHNIVGLVQDWCTCIAAALQVKQPGPRFNIR